MKLQSDCELKMIDFDVGTTGTIGMLQVNSNG